jgi:DNA transformation protein
MKPFRPNAKQTLKSYYQVPADVVEDSDMLCKWAAEAAECQRNKI